MMNWSSPSSILLTLLIAKYTRTCQGSDFLVDKPISTKSGPVLGPNREYKGRFVKEFLGIPYAKPPVGELRFKKPQPVEPWNAVLMAYMMPPACMQYIGYPFPWYDFNNGKSEDCLFLNIWVPLDNRGNIRSERLPTIFWIYGGGFTVGSNRQNVYQGHVLAAEGDVIVVTINYRMGAFGFLTSGSEEAPGNVGMYDMLEALKWVHSNINNFGGNPSKITIAGESAGSIAVGLLCVSPLARGLFHAVIMESGSPAYMYAEDDTVNVDTSQKLAKALRCATDELTIDKHPETVVQCLRAVEAIDIAKTLNSFHPTSARSFFPSYGDELLPVNARKALIEGNFTNVPVLIGNNKDEGAFQITTAYQEVFGFYGELNPQINRTYAESIMRDIFKINSYHVIEHYLGDLEETDYDRLREQVYTASGDYSLLCPTVYFAESYAREGNDVYFYYFIQRPSTTPWAEWMGVAHFEEVQFVFGVPMLKPDNYTYEEIFLSREIMQKWSEFAKYGTLDWGTYTRQRPQYNELHTEHWSTYGLGPHGENCNFFRKYFGFDQMLKNY